MSGMIGPDQLHNPDGSGVRAGLSEHGRTEGDVGLSVEDLDAPPDPDTEETPEEDIDLAEEASEEAETPPEAEGTETEADAAEEAEEGKTFELPEEFHIEGYGKATRKDFIDILQTHDTMKSKIETLEESQKSPEDDRYIQFGKKLEAILGDQAVTGEMTARNTEGFRKLLDEAKQGLKGPNRDPELQALLDERREAKAERGLNEIVGSLKAKYPDIVDDKFEQSVSRSIVKAYEGYDGDTKLRIVNAIHASVAEILEDVRQKGVSTVTKALKEQPRGTKLVTKSGKKLAKPPKRRPEDLSEDEVRGLLDEAAFS